jgi:sugar phosphate isomerase/epimerase
MKEGNLRPHAPAFRKDATEQSLKTIDAAVLLGADFIVQHVLLIADSSGSQQGYVLKNTVPDLEEVVQYAAAKRVQVAIENVPSSSFRMLGTSLQELVAVLQLFPPETVGLCLDLNHCLACGFDPREALTTMKIHRLISIHASDNLYSPLADRHLPIGKGEILWDKIFTRLSALAFQGSFVIEVLDEKALMDSISYLRSNDVLDLRKSLLPTIFDGDLEFPKRM